jgi:hypothetical protein
MIRKKAEAAVFCLNFVFLRLQMTAGSGPTGVTKQFWRRVQQLEEFSMLGKAA